MVKSVPAVESRVLSPSEYPPRLLEPRGAYTPKVLFAAQHPRGLYHVEDEGAGLLGVYFTPLRAKTPRRFASARAMSTAFQRISIHEDEMLHPEAAREEGRQGPVSIFELGRRLEGPKPPSQLDRELNAWLKTHGYK
jgi:hypothetical protein